MSEPVIAALVGIATSDTDSNVRVEAAQVLGSGGGLSEPVIAALVRIATSDTDWYTRRNAVAVLRQAPPTHDLRNHLQSLFKDPDNDVRREAGNVLVELSRQHPESAADIRSDLVRACNDPALNKEDQHEHRTGWDYAYNALRSHIDTLPQ